MCEILLRRRNKNSGGNQIVKNKYSKRHAFNTLNLETVTKYFVIHVNLFECRIRRCIGLMHLAIFLGEYPFYSPSLVLVAFLKVAIPLVKINILN